jgi:hypothetical protein
VQEQNILAGFEKVLPVQVIRVSSLCVHR